MYIVFNNLNYFDDLPKEVAVEIFDDSSIHDADYMSVNLNKSLNDLSNASL